MARFEILDSTMAPLGEGPASGDMLFELGMMYSVGRDVPVDLVSAHKWFNLAAVKGNAEAIRLRREIANQMSDAEIAVAQRAARELAGVAGSEVTPRLLARMAELSGGQSLDLNVELVVNNARVAALVAAAALA